MTRALRSPGSSLKPFIYAFAFEEGLAAPETRLADAPVAFADYEPENFDRIFHGEVTAAPGAEELAERAGGGHAGQGRAGRLRGAAGSHRRPAGPAHARRPTIPASPWRSAARA